MNFKHLACAALLVTATSACSKKEKTTEGEAQKAASPGLFSTGATKVKSLGRAHLPEGCEFIGRIDWPRFRELKVVKTNLEEELTKYKKPLPEDPKEAEDIKKVKEFLEKTQIDPEKDLGEMALCAWNFEQAEKTDKPPTFVFAWGGNFIPGAAFDALTSFSERFKTLVQRLQDGDLSGKKEDVEIVEIGGLKAARDKESDTYFTQAKDGAFIISNDRVAFEKALQTSSAHEAYHFPSAPIGVALTQHAPSVEAQLQKSPLAAFAKSFSGGALSYDDNLVQVQIRLNDEKQLPALQTTVEGFLRANASAPTPFSPVLQKAKAKTEGGGVTVDLPIPDEFFQGLLAQMGIPLPAPAPATTGVPSGVAPAP